MVIYVTNRKLCGDDFLHRIDRLASGKPNAIILREKDLGPAQYETLAARIQEICEKHGVPLIINQNIAVAAKLQIPSIGLSMENLRKNKNELGRFLHIGASVHTIDEAVEAQRLGATYLVAGHIFPTDCKKGVPPRGLAFLYEVCSKVSLPVFAIGGITADNVDRARWAGAEGICIMSEAMTTQNPVELGSKF